MKILLLFVLTALCGVAEATTFYLYSCPLSSSASSLSSSGNKDCSSSKRDIDHGFVHTYLQIGSTCYDWGNWNYPRHLPCDDQGLACCVQTKSFINSRTTSCADRVGEFEVAWTNKGIRYDFLAWNCQRFTNMLFKFLASCYPDASTVIG
ncbi:uncharacterized protein LOC128557664 [Mercenaria mercenaria]|uniref:uncharacterized protein LOC128557664 n=1 Tax=Mercenaria mercenaria TaxID=6596 RepID=UPI00234E719C|nr:uncharacterized protein LOC128557664 [Mercenaria mercenaria]